MKKATDPYLALLNYRSTPLSWCNHSPAELLMGRKIRTTLPIVTERLQPNWSYMEEFRLLDRRYKQQMKTTYDQRHRTRSLPILSAPTPVFVNTPRGRQITGTVIRKIPSPRSYQVETPSGTIRRNRLHLTPIPLSLTDSPSPPVINVRLPTETKTRVPHSPIVPTGRSPIMTRTKTGTAINPPQKLTF